MTTIAVGLTTAGVLPAPPTTEGRFVFAIVVAPNPAETAVTTFQLGGTTLVAFNIPLSAGGAMDPPYIHASAHADNILDPTLFSIGTGSAFVSYRIL
jgi:hypothetical protein